MGLLGAFIFLGGILRSCRPFSGGSGGGGRYHHSHYGGYHHGYRGNTVLGLFTGCTLACVGVVALSSAVLAGLRRATGLTIRHKHQMPAVDIKRTELWLQWYDSKLARINEKAKEKIAAAVGRYGPEIRDPAVRDVWESQLRADVLEKINRLRERRNHYYDLLAHAKKMKLHDEQQQQMNITKEGLAPSAIDSHGAQRLAHPPLLAAYLLVGEWLFDAILSWARSSPHFCYESTNSAASDSAGLPGSVSYDELLDGASPAAPLLANVPSSHAALLDSPAQSLVASSNIGPSAYPAPYIASSSLLSPFATAPPPLPSLSPPAAAAATTILHSTQLPPDSKMPEPSAPALTESQFLRLVHSSRSVPSLRAPPSFAPLASAATSSRHASQPAAARSSEDSTAINVNVNVNDFDPPPYALIGHDDVANLVPGPASGSGSASASGSGSASASASGSGSSSEQKHAAVPDEID
ncbi:hypothetical protein IWW48_002536 [Coemansia sp. RSA 1200]|nr:hypothetical protein IWW48_002536 [Coemansia sp. RSA 1200]